MEQSDEEQQDLINSHVEGLKETLEFFSPEKKVERELWIGRKFLSYLGFGDVLDEIQPSDDEPPDLIFREAKFELKEIMDEGRLRGKEYKEALATAKQATSYSDLLEEYSPQSLAICDAAEIACQQAHFWSQKYASAVARNLDLLFYLNWQDYSIDGNSLECLEALNQEHFHMWRSVSVVSNDCAFVLSGHEESPGFIFGAIGNVYGK